MDSQDIIRAIDSQNYRITHHADEEARDDGLDFDFEGIFYSTILWTVLTRALDLSKLEARQ